MKTEYDIMQRISSLKDDIEELEREGLQSILTLMLLEQKRAKLKELRWLMQD